MAYAFVTLVTSDAYLPGALVVAAALRDLHPSPAQPPEVEFQTLCLVTPETVDVKTINLLRRVFDLVVGVEVIAVDQSAGLDLLGRPDLHTVLTKLHMLRLTQFDKIIFLDADVLPLRPLSHLFSLPHDFAAVPDVGWPDIFNSGVMVFAPGEDKFNQVMSLVHSKGSWDGGDQGILNEWRGDNWHRLSFKYNTTPTAAYTYAPAYERFGSSISAIHFIGPNKPWSSIPFRAPASQSSHPSSSALESYAYGSLVDRWYSVYDKHFRSVNVASGIIGQPSTSFEGSYTTLPLEGRVDLIRPGTKRTPGPVPPRPQSPPKVIWNPAVEPPPKDHLPVSHLPISAFYPNAWDKPQGQRHRRSAEEEQAHRDLQFFQPPAVPQIPETLRKAYGTMVPDVLPDRSRVASVFPWEEQPRNAPQRYFPRTDAPPPGLPYITTAPPPQRSSDPTSNAWDQVPSIQKYATRLTRLDAPIAQPPAEPLPVGHRRRRSESYPVWDEVEDSSRDGDAEDEDSESEQSTRSARTVSSSKDSDSGRTVSSPTTSIASTILSARLDKSRSRRGSRASAVSEKDDRSQGAQTPTEETGPEDARQGRLDSPLFRPAGRSWDPARGVDVFKKGSEEVLARFLHLDSWNESPQRASPPAV